LGTDPGLDEDRPQAAEARTDAALDRALRLVEEDGHLPVGMTAEVGELDGRPLAGREDDMASRTSSATAMSTTACSMS